MSEYKYLSFSTHPVYYTVIHYIAYYILLHNWTVLYLLTITDKNCNACITKCNTRLSSGKERCSRECACWWTQLGSLSWPLHSGSSWTCSALISSSLYLLSPYLSPTSSLDLPTFFWSVLHFNDLQFRCKIFESWWV